MKKLIREIHRRSLWQVLGIYVVASWIVLQVIDVLGNNLGLPEWVPPFAIVLLLIGLPVVLATAFVQEGIAPARAERGAGAAEPATEPEQTAREPSQAAREPGQAAREPSPSEGPAAPEPLPSAVGPGSRHRVLTWRNAWVGGGAAFALLGLVTVGYMLMRTLGIGPAGTLVAKGVLEERATIVIADFASTDSLLGRAATEAMRIDLSQSSIVRLAEPAFVAEALRRMGRDPGEPLDLEAARELALREGLPAVLGGEINPAGGGYLLSVELVAAPDGRVLVSHREIADDSAGILAAIDDLSKRVRERIGESLRTLHGDPPLERVTTPSLVALEKYSLAVRAIDVYGQDARGIALLEEAVAIDPGFAMAHRKVGMVFRNRFEERGRMVEAMTRAFENRDRLTERERYMATAAYHQAVTGDWEQVVVAYQNLLEIDPGHSAAANNLGVTYEILRDDERAEEMYELSVRLDSTFATGFANLISPRFHQGDIDGARSALLEAAARFPDNSSVEWYEYHLSAVSGDYPRADSGATAFAEKFGADLFLKATAAADRASLAAARGRVAEARAHASEALVVHAERELAAQYLTGAVQIAWIELLVREDAEGALETIAEAERRYTWSEIEALDRPYLVLAELYAYAGRSERARRLLEELEAEVPPELRTGEGYLPDLHRVQGALALAEGDLPSAIEEYRLSDREVCRPCAFIGLARAYELAGQRDSALVVTRRLLDTPFFYRFWNGEAALGPAHGPALERLGQLYDEAGDPDNAAKYYAQFVELWAEADEELQPRVAAAQARLEEIVRARG